MDINLAPAFTIDSEHPLIVSKARALTAALNTPAQKAEAIFNFVRDGIKYSMYAVKTDPAGYKASFILSIGQGWCLQKSILFTALARATGIPAKIVLASLKNYRAPEKAITLLGSALFMPYAYVEIWINQRWIKLAPIFNHTLCDSQRLPTVYFSADHDAILAETDLDGRPYIEYIDDFGSFTDVPWTDLLERNRRVYGSTSVFWFTPDFSI